LALLLLPAELIEPNIVEISLSSVLTPSSRSKQSAAKKKSSRSRVSRCRRDQFEIQPDLIIWAELEVIVTQNTDDTVVHLFSDRFDICSAQL